MKELPSFKFLVIPWWWYFGWRDFIKWKIFLEILEFMYTFNLLSFTHVYKECNGDVDALCKDVLISHYTLSNLFWATYVFVVLFLDIPLGSGIGMVFLLSREPGTISICWGHERDYKTFVVILEHMWSCKMYIYENMMHPMWRTLRCFLGFQWSF